MFFQLNTVVTEALSLSNFLFLFFDVKLRESLSILYMKIILKWILNTRCLEPMGWTQLVHDAIFCRGFVDYDNELSGSMTVFLDVEPCILVDTG